MASEGLSGSAVALIILFIGRLRMARVPLPRMDSRSNEPFMSEAS